MLIAHDMIPDDDVEWPHTLVHIFGTKDAFSAAAKDDLAKGLMPLIED